MWWWKKGEIGLMKGRSEAEGQVREEDGAGVGASGEEGPV